MYAGNTSRVVTVKRVRILSRMFKKAVQQGRSERRPEAYPLGYVEDLRDARTKLADFFNIMLLDEIEFDA
jgi:hypothetical protein